MPADQTLVAVADSRTGDRSTTESAPVAVTVLSEAEQRVAALAVRGYTNRDIAAQLYLTVSTVEQHLTRTFRKLKVSRRRDLPTNLDSCRYTDLRYSRMHA